MSFKSIEIAKIDVGDRLRQIHPGWVQAFADEISQGATLSPIEVVETGERFRLITGGHRLQATVSLGRAEIEAKVWPADAFPNEGAMRLKEIQDNVLRFEPTVLDRSVAILAWKEIFEETMPKPKRGRPSAEIAADSARIFAERFSAAAARAMGISERSIQVAVQIATGLSSGTRRAIAFAEIADNASELLQLAHQDPGRQAKIVDLLLSEPPQAGSVAEAIAVLDRTPAPAPLAGWERVSDRFSRLPASQQTRFFEAHADAIDRWLASRGRRAA